MAIAKKGFTELDLRGQRPAVGYDFYKSSGCRSDLSEFEPSLARQEFAEECDINTLMERYEKSGAFTHVNRALPIYMDCTQIPDLRGAIDVMREATASFNSLPAKVRREFDNDPQKFVDFARDPANVQQMKDWGLGAPEEPVQAPIKVEMVNSPPDDKPSGDVSKPA